MVKYHIPLKHILKGFKSFSNTNFKIPHSVHNLQKEIYVSNSILIR